MAESAIVTVCCIKGEKWPATSIKSFVDTNNFVGEESVIFYCPKGHKFTLKDALSAGIFTQDQAQKIMAGARRLNEEWKRDLRVHRPSDYLPDKELEKQNLPCARCGKKARRHRRGAVLCLDCLASFDNYLEKYEENDGVYEVMYGHWGKAEDILWEKLFSRFSDSLPPLGKQEMEELFLQCKKEVRKSYGKKAKKTSEVA